MLVHPQVQRAAPTLVMPDERLPCRADLPLNGASRSHLPLSPHNGGRFYDAERDRTAISDAANSA